MRWDTCDKCEKHFSPKRLRVVKVCGAMQDSPAEYETRCDNCYIIERERAEQREERRQLRGYSDEERERI